MASTSNVSNGNVYNTTVNDGDILEIDKNSVIYTDEMLTESYFNAGNRRTLNDPENNVMLFSQQNVGKNWGKNSCASQVTDCNLVEPLFNQIINRAQTLGLKKRMNALVLDKDPQLCIQTESGKIIYSHAQNKDRFLFAVPNDIENIHLISNVGRPNDTIGGQYVDDKRSLGVLIGNITLLSQNNMKAIDAHLSQTNLKGWHGIESNLYRWTDGNAYLPLGTEYNNADDPRVNILVVHVVAGGPCVSLDEEFKQIA
ncbi:hypothetical protein [Commensalibacter papalotli (ex Botero et al. 2024)]|uniref:Uncharacterized protein n=1 Tax=Commensalibacter papalotli (ex Botero et al. 2024) TaxID=2972766 RepID=A0ABM9HIH8_9PROT|nr:hypothetical protein [Commensalibacter papalotli (ex Botero et al. 2024)]CAI3924914.1 unnamed protein product [Commensalibacter papalotli (ex Botero et al. 2024)]